MGRLNGFTETEARCNGLTYSTISPALLSIFDRILLGFFVVESLELEIFRVLEFLDINPLMSGVQIFFLSELSVFFKIGTLISFTVKIFYLIGSLLFMLLFLCQWITLLWWKDPEEIIQGLMCLPCMQWAQI